jgi:hypothetical protein
MVVVPLGTLIDHDNTRAIVLRRPDRVYDACVHQSLAGVAFDNKLDEVRLRRPPSQSSACSWGRRQQHRSKLHPKNA